MNIPIVFSTDHNYVMQTGVAILSLIKSASDSIYEIYVIINDDVTEEDKLLLNKQISLFPIHTIDFIEIGDIFEESFEVRGISTAAYSRLLIPWLLPQYDKVIYSDVDVIFRIDLEKVYKEDLSNYYLGAVPSVAASIYTSYRKYIFKLGFKLDEYCNSGFLLINCKQQRGAGLKQIFLKEAKKNYIFQDQDIINIICKGHIKFLSQKYNLTPYFYTLVKSKNNILNKFYGSPALINKYLNSKDCILHYAGDKPWKTFTYAWTDWWMTYRESIFYNQEFELLVSHNILNEKPTWKAIAKKIKRKLLN